MNSQRYNLTDGINILASRSMDAVELSQASELAAQHTAGNLFWQEAYESPSFAHHGQQEDSQSITGRGFWGNGY